MRRSLALLATPLLALAFSAITLAAPKLIYETSFEDNLAKWGIGADGINMEPVGEQAAIFKGLAKTGNSCLELRHLDPNGIYMFLPEFNLKTGYVEAWLYDKTGDRSEFVDQAYLVIGGPGGENAGTGWVQLGQDGNPERTEDQTRYSLLAGGTWLTDVAARSKGWHKFGFELKEDGVVRLYIDDKLQSEVQDNAFQPIALVGFLSYLPGERDGAIGDAINISYWDDLKIYDSKP